MTLGTWGRDGLDFSRTRSNDPVPPAQLLGAAAGLLSFCLLWTTVAIAYDQDPSTLRPRDLYPFASAAALFAAGGALAGAFADSGRPRVAWGIAAGASLAFLPAAFLVLQPFVLPVAIPAVAVVAAGGSVGGLAGLVAHALRRPSGQAAPRKA